MNTQQDFHRIDPRGPIDVLRGQLVAIVEELILKTKYASADWFLLKGSVLPLLRTDDVYVRHQARTIVRTASRRGVKVEVRKR